MTIRFLRFRAGRDAARLLVLGAILHLVGCGGAPIEGERLERLRADVKAAAVPGACIRAIGPRPLRVGDRPADVTMPVIVQGTQVAEFHLFDLYFKAAFVATDEMRALGMSAALSTDVWGARRESMRFAATQLSPEALEVALAEIGAQEDVPQLLLLDHEAKNDLYASRRTLLSARSALPRSMRVARAVIVCEGAAGAKVEVDVQAALHGPQPIDSSGYSASVERQLERYALVNGVETEAADGDPNEALIVQITTPQGQTERRVLFFRSPDKPLGARLDLPFRMVFRRVAARAMTARDVRDAYFLGDDGDAPPLSIELDVQLLEAVAEDSALASARRARVVLAVRILDARDAKVFEGSYEKSATADGTGAKLVRGRYVFTLGDDEPIEKALRLAMRAAVRDALPAIARTRAP